MSLRNDGLPPPLNTVRSGDPVSTLMPSTYTSGSLESEALLSPRIRTREPKPTLPFC